MAKFKILPNGAEVNTNAPADPIDNYEMRDDYSDLFEPENVMTLDDVLARVQVREDAPVYYKPVKTQVNMRLDMDVVDTIKAMAKERGMGYQTLINSMLRSLVQSHIG